MNVSTSGKRSPLKFFLLVFALSLLFWSAGPIAEHFSVVLPFFRGGAMILPVNVLLGGFAPLIAAFILVSREEKPGGIGSFMKRLFDWKRIRPRIWYVPLIFLNPLIFLLTYWVMLLLGRPLPVPSIPFLLIPLFFVGFFFEAVGEEGGWMGYAIDPMQARWGALKAGLILGLIGAIWHIIPAIQDHQTLTYTFWQGLTDIGGRVLCVWLYYNTGKSLFGAILFHDMYNVGFVLFPNYGSGYDPAVAFPITTVMVLIVVFLWGAKTLARYRYAHTQRDDEQSTEIG